MNATGPWSEGNSLSAVQLARMAALCERFRAAWRSGDRPRAEVVVAREADEDRPVFLPWLLAVEVDVRRRLGEAPSWGELLARFPGREALVHAALRATPAMGSDARKAPPPLPAQLGRYRIMAVLGSGGFGMVYRAHDDILDRAVAIKVPHLHCIRTPADAEAYTTEARVVAALDHQNIVPVHDVGTTDDGLPFVVSKFIDGRTLAAELTRGRLPVEKSARLAAEVADALHHAHVHGVVHRDVKPSNILLDPAGRAFVADFGLAIREADFGRGSGFAGTPAYMSPEQARGEGHRVDGRSDIFSLGVVLYKMLTGRGPFRGETITEIVDQVIRVEARPPRQLDDAIPVELERVCLKCLSKAITDRYTTARDLADDLRCFLSAVGKGQPAAPPTPTAGQSARPIVKPAAQPAAGVVPKGLKSFGAGDTDFFLDLLPGPRDRNGLPEVIRFWKGWADQNDPDQTFPVGLIYGPSGCGKSSLVKAGLIPRLAAHVTPIYIEATADGTEVRLLKGLRKHCPGMPGGELAPMLAAVRRGTVGPPDGKILLVIDQFEQWLHARPDVAGAELVDALRQCDGGRVQCLLSVRDDFWMAVTRFLKAVEVPLMEGENSAAVDLFDARHARAVLTLFGRAYGALPARNADLTAEQTCFIDRAFAGLAREGKVAPIRLAVFADMLKGQAWKPAALAAAGGAEGVGVAFLDGAFAARTAVPAHRLHRRAAATVLRALLPEQGTDIRGTMRSRDELLRASGYAERPQNFDDLIRILDRELRLVTPSDPEGLEAESGDGSGMRERHHYQLTHDYLVPSLRAWLTRRQQETRRGRAELRLAERAALWAARPGKRSLPAWWEWAVIRLLTRPRNWTEPQRVMMRATDRFYLTRGLVLAAVLLAVGWVGREYVGRLHARSLRSQLLTAQPAKVPDLLAAMAPYRRWVDPLLEADDAALPADNSRERLNLSLALLPAQPDLADYLCGRLLGADPQEFHVIRDALAPYRNQLAGRLWVVLGNDRAEPGRRFRAACTLAAYAPDDPRWDQVAPAVIAQLLTQNPLDLAQWKGALTDVGKHLLPPLAEAMEDQGRSATERKTLAKLYEGYAAGQPDAFDRLEQRLSAAGPPGESPTATAWRRANVGAALAAMGRWDVIWPRLVHTPDPTLRSCLIERLVPGGADTGVLERRLARDPEVSVRRAIILALGGAGPDRLQEPARQSLLPELLRRYRDDPDPGTHAAAEWTVRSWGQSARLAEAGHGLETGRVEKDRGWYVTRNGQTFVIIPPPGPHATAARKEGSMPAPSSRFALAATKVTVAQFLAFRGNHPVDRTVSPTNDCPASGVSWYDAVEYCNFLSEQEGIEKSQWCYKRANDGLWDFVPDYRIHTGYRLPTEDEWTYACQAGARTLFGFGEADEDLVSQYAWWLRNGHADGVQRSFPVALLKPNDWGIFDMHGNVYEWSQEVPTQPGSLLGDIAAGGRGGAYFSAFRSVAWDKGFILGRKANAKYFGFRPARSVP